MQHLIVPLDTTRPYVVTGAASGVGAAVTELLARHGAGVVTVDLEASGAVHGDRHVVGDVADSQTWGEVARIVAEESADGAAGFISCAGAIVVAGLDSVTAVDDFQRLFRINTVGVLRGIQALVPAMAARGDGSVVAVASIDSLFAEDMMSAYATSKGALLQLVRSAALEYARFGVRVNALCPGAIDTPLLRQHLDATGDPDAARSRIENVTPVGRLLTSAEIAQLLVVLSTPLASAMSGAAVVADGGLTTTYDFRLEA